MIPRVSLVKWAKTDSIPLPSERRDKILLLLHWHINHMLSPKMVREKSDKVESAGKSFVSQKPWRPLGSLAVTRIRTWVVSATTRSTNHYTITAKQADLWVFSKIIFDCSSHISPFKLHSSLHDNETCCTLGLITASGTARSHEDVLTTIRSRLNRLTYESYRSICHIN